MSHRFYKPIAMGTGLAAALALASPAAAAPYFAKKTITIQVPSGSGGTYHVYCQTVQRLITKYIPGKPKSIIQNRPGAGGAKSAAYMMTVAPKNGTLIAMIAPGTITTPLVRKVKFDARKFEWLGSLAARSNAVWAWHTSKFRTLADIKKNRIRLATSGFASAGSVFPRLLNDLIGTKIKLIYGYKGGGAINLAVERGEAEGRWNFRSGFTGVRPTWLPEKKVIPLIAMGPRDPKLKGVPHLRDQLKPGSVEQKLYDLLAMNLEVGQAFYVPPGTPKNVVAILKKAFADMVADPATLKEILKRRIEFSPKTAAEVVAEIDKGFAGATPAVLKRLRAIYTKKKS
jgi:tripartite-type tricarboxylate transporter receptor subunit TctC